MRALLEEDPRSRARARQRRKRRVRHRRTIAAAISSSIAEPDAWFTYYYWLGRSRAPDFARTVDIHRKPGYDPAELFLDPAIRLPALKVGWKLAKKKLGFRTLMDVIPLDAALVKGSHGRRPADEDDDAPVFITRCAKLMPSRTIESVDVHGLILRHLEKGDSHLF